MSATVPNGGNLNVQQEMAQDTVHPHTDVPHCNKNRSQKNACHSYRNFAGHIHRTMQGVESNTYVVRMVTTLKGGERRSADHHAGDLPLYR